ncbi:hypothetical protein OIU77_017183 [Salix suchowensis]|uniref:Uncharacterized protein n=1 Tax=Salix suchowensis TaxID=1278906 RepID=A0ABQ8ZNG9_9ROSI|nr:hypothetical protein OIU77_017183 [Salix suchowensis]
MNTEKRKVLEQNCTSLEKNSSHHQQMASNWNVGFRFLSNLQEGSIPKFNPGTSDQQIPSEPIISGHFASPAPAPYAPEGCKGLSYDTSNLSACSPVGKTPYSAANPQNYILALKSSLNLINSQRQSRSKKSRKYSPRFVSEFAEKRSASSYPTEASK